ncbi:MAG: hypothetical protein FWE23_01020 [Chitinivibrionia bacterium]|nr:hypothetical protein [Chitinivibrionia bacterium]
MLPLSKRYFTIPCESAIFSLAKGATDFSIQSFGTMLSASVCKIISPTAIFIACSNAYFFGEKPSPVRVIRISERFFNFSLKDKTISAVLSVERSSATIICSNSGEYV